MRQYLNLLKEIKEKGTKKPAAREGMPGSLSLFGAQSRYNLQEGFPLLTTKQLSFKNIVVELLWFLRGDTNIKYLIDNGCNIWNEDAYNYYLKQVRPYHHDFEEFISLIEMGDIEYTTSIEGYRLGDCGYQYGKTWRSWDNISMRDTNPASSMKAFKRDKIDQIANLIKSLKETPESRRHIVINTDPAHDTELALYWCHSMFQMNCRPIPLQERQILGGKPSGDYNLDSILDVPKYYLDCHMYQRSADVFLGVPYNIASYALLTHILAKICNMIPGELIQSYGDVHIYENHMEQVDEQLNREPRRLPTLWMAEQELKLEEVNEWEIHDFSIQDYNPHPKIRGKLSTGLK